MADPEEKQEAAQQEAAQAEESSFVAEMTAKWTEEATSLAPDTQEIGKDLIQFFKGRITGVRIDANFFNSALSELDLLISGQLDEVLHHEDFQRLESAWTGLKWLCDRTDFSQNIRFDLINVSKRDLLQDFEDAVGPISTTGLYQHIYTKEYGTPNGKPYGGMIMNYEFSHSAPDMALLGKVAEIANMAHAPVISSVSPDLFGPKGFEHLTDNRFSVKEALAGKEYVKWNGFREDENARYVGLTLPHFLLRLPYNEKDNIKDFKYTEEVGGKNKNYLWGNAAFAFASRLTDAFRKYRWCWRIVGEESGGAIPDLNVHVFDEHGEKVQKPPTDVSISFAKEDELNEAGLAPLLWLKEKDQSVIYRAQSVKLPLRYPDTPEGRQKERDDKIRTMLPYVFILTRMAHYMKRLQTAYIGKATTRTRVQKELSEWIRQYVNQDDNPQPGTLGRTPLYRAEVNVEEDEKNPGVFLCEIKMTPHTYATGFTTTLSLVTRQDTNA
jgi:type VI secretion system protein ImpC